MGPNNSAEYRAMSPALPPRLTRPGMRNHRARVFYHISARPHSQYCNEIPDENGPGQRCIDILGSALETLLSLNFYKYYGSLFKALLSPWSDWQSVAGRHERRSMRMLRLCVIPVLVAVVAGAAGATSSRAQDATSFGFANGDVGAITDQALSGVAGQQLSNTTIAPATNITSNNSAVGVPPGVTPSPLGLEIVTPQVGGMRVLGAGIIGTRTTGSGIF